MRRTHMTKGIAIMAVIACVVTITGCRKPYHEKVYHEAKANETVFMIQAEGNSENQDMFSSVKFLESNMIAAKRFEVPYKWHQTGRKMWMGRWIPAVIIETVDRTPVTRVLTADTASGTSKANQALKAESKDSLFVSSGFAMTAMIEPEDAAKFLYKFKGVPLATVMDNQVRNSVQTEFTTQCARYDLMDLPGKKGEITKEIRKKVIPQYKEWGITLSEDMGLVGGLVYDPKVQEQIDLVFQTKKAAERAEAEFVKQQITNSNLLSVAKNDAEMLKATADAEAYAIDKKAEAIKSAGNAFIQDKFIDKWDGVMPKVSGGTDMMLMLGNDTVK